MELNNKLKELTLKAGKVEQSGPEVWSDNQVLYLVELVLEECLETVLHKDSGKVKGIREIVARERVAKLIQEKFGMK